MSDIESIWSELKLESEKVYGGGNSTRTEKKKALNNESLSKRDEMTENKFVDIVSQVSKMLNHNLPPGVFPSSTTSLAANCFKKTDDTMVLIDDATNNINLLDSDDDSDNDSDDNDSKDEKSNDVRLLWTIGRFNSAIQDSDISVRIHVLQVLHNHIVELCNGIETPPKLSFRPPYDLSRICLTRQANGVVSDLATDSHDFSHWALYWGKTHSKLSDQFQGQEELIMRINRSNSNETGVISNKTDKLQQILHGCGKAIFKQFSNVSEKCRKLALSCTEKIVLYSCDFNILLPYLMSSWLSRYPEVCFDQELGVFVYNAEMNDKFKRGVAVDRQDRVNLLCRDSSIKLVETSEDLRKHHLEVLSSLLRSTVHHQCISIMRPYCLDILLVLQNHLRDTCPQIIADASRLLVNVIRIPEWEQLYKTFAVALARAALPNLRHRNYKVRIASLELFEASVSIPDREKVKGAGSAAVLDLVGFRDETVLPVAAFYDTKCGTTVNTLAEIVNDGSSSVRERCCLMLSFFIVCLPDRYDHQQRLLPYILSFYYDSICGIRQSALSAVESCGQQYEIEHPDDIIEKKQLGIDGDETLYNYDDKLPFPFQSRPSLGSRLFVRGNTKRFLNVLLDELTSWQSSVRLQSANLLLVLCVYFEEHITMESCFIILKLSKALQLARSDESSQKNLDLISRLILLFETLGRYVDSHSYLTVLIPRIIGDESSATTFGEGGSHSEASRIVSLLSLHHLIRGSLPKQILLNLKLVNVLIADDNLLYSSTNSYIRCEYLSLLLSIVEKLVQFTPGNIISLHFEETGRLVDLKLLKERFLIVFGSVCECGSIGKEQALASKGLHMVKTLHT